MFCWPSRRSNSNTKNRKKSKSTDFSSTGDDDSVSGRLGESGGILVKPSYKTPKKGKKSAAATFKCDLSEALLSPSDECLLSSRSASCNSSIRDLHHHHHSYHHNHRGGTNNKHFVSSSQHLSSNFSSRADEKDEDSVSVNNNNNNNNRSAEVLLFYSNNSLSTRNSLADFIENEEFNYKSLWGKDISEWDAREQSKCNTLERDNKSSQENYYVKTGAANNSITPGSGGSKKKNNIADNNNKTDINGGKITTPSKSIIGGNDSKPKTDRLALKFASSSPSLSISLKDCSNNNKENSKLFTSTNFVEHDDDDEPLPSPPPTPPEIKLALSDKSSLGTCSFFKYPEDSEDLKSNQPLPFRVHSSTSTSSLSSSCILTPEIIEKPSAAEISTLIEHNNKKGASDCETQTLPFWQLEFPGILHCSCSQSSEESAIILSNSGIGNQLEDSSSTPTSSTRSSGEVVDTPTPSSSILCARGHESPGGDSSSGISSSDDNLESLHAEEEIMLKSLKNSFLHQAIPFQLCSFGGGGNNRNGGVSRCTCCKEKPRSGVVLGVGGEGGGVLTSIANNNSSVHSIINNEFANSVVTNSNLIEKQKVQEQNYKNQQQTTTATTTEQQKEEEQLKGKCELSIVVEETISSTVTNHQDRNRLGPGGKNCGSAGLDANANESGDSAVHIRSHGHTNGDIGKPSTKSADGGVAEPLIEPTKQTASKKSANKRVSSTNQQNIQNSLLVQENSALKEEVSKLVVDLKQQITRASSEEEKRKALEEQLVKADVSCTALSIVTQQVEQEKIRISDELSKEKAQSKEWKLRLDEKLTELQNLQEKYEEEREIHQEEFRTLSSNHEIEVDVTVRNCELKLEQLQKRHDETLAELKRSHNDELERIQEIQRQELEQTVQKHRELLDQHRNQSPHDILLKEVTSLESVLEMRNEEIRVLRKDLMDYKNTVNDLQLAREHGKSLQAKIEDLEAQLEKARADKRNLHEQYQALQSQLQQLESENSRLARGNDELNWKLKSYLVEN